ncbi:MAG: peptidoglycan-binding domain-containing protein [Methylotenera sp.]
MNTQKALVLAVLAALASGCAAQRTNNGLVETSNQYGYSNQVTAPPAAKPGECYINLHNKPVTEQVTQQVLKRAASQKVEVVPATFAEGEETIMVKPATTRLEVIPAVYETVEEQVLVKPASKRLVPVDAVYEDKSEQVLVSEASTYWKRSTVAEAARSGSKEQIAGDDGYVMCLIEKPAVYKTVTNKVMVKGPGTREEEVPAEYTTVQKTVLKTPATTREVEVPAEYAKVKTTKLATPASEKITEIPAEYDTVTSTKTVSAGSWEWRQILCATNSTPAKLQEIESALSAAGQNPGNIDGIVDNNTLTAIQAYQAAKGLPVDRGRYINIQTVKALGVASN